MAETREDPPSLPSSQPAAPPAPRPPVVVLVRDLMFSSRIAATARAANVDVKLLRDPAALAGTEGRLVIVDLNQPGALDAAAAWKAQAPREVVGFVSHVDAGTISRAKAAGLDRVLPRSRFVEMLPDLLSR
jgi:DNA-binding NarL/FixJ family response regulator